MRSTLDQDALAVLTLSVDKPPVRMIPKPDEKALLQFIGSARSCMDPDIALWDDRCSSERAHVLQ